MGGAPAFLGGAENVLGTTPPPFDYDEDCSKMSDRDRRRSSVENQVKSSLVRCDNELHSRPVRKLVSSFPDAVSCEDLVPPPRVKIGDTSSAHVYGDYDNVPRPTCMETMTMSHVYGDYDNFLRKYGDGTPGDGEVAKRYMLEKLDREKLVSSRRSMFRTGGMGAPRRDPMGRRF